MRSHNFIRNKFTRSQLQRSVGVKRVYTSLSPSGLQFTYDFFLDIS